VSSSSMAICIWRPDGKQLVQFTCSLDEKDEPVGSSVLIVLRTSSL
jgi:hypothetical protein